MRFLLDCRAPIAAWSANIGLEVARLTKLEAAGRVPAAFIFGALGLAQFSNYRHNPAPLAVDSRVERLRAEKRGRERGAHAPRNLLGTVHWHYRADARWADRVLPRRICPS